MNSIPPPEARSIALQILAELATGTDPTAAKNQSATLADILARYNKLLDRVGTGSVSM